MTTNFRTGNVMIRDDLAAHPGHSALSC